MSICVSGYAGSIRRATKVAPTAPWVKTPTADQMLIQRLKKRKLALKDRIVQLETLLIPDIIA